MAIVFAISAIACLTWTYIHSHGSGTDPRTANHIKFGKASFSDHFVGATGIAIKSYGSEYPSVQFVATGSAAQRAGVKPYDQISKIDGTDTRLMTAPEIEAKLMGQPLMPISLGLKRFNEKEQFANFSRGVLSQCSNLVERSTLRLCVKDMYNQEDLRHSFFLPYLFYSKRSTIPASVVFEFYDSKHRPAKVPPTIRYSNYWKEPLSPNHLPPLNPDGLHTEQPQTDVLRFSLDDPLVRAAAAKLNITKAPAYLYQITNSQIVFESRMVRNPGPDDKPLVLLNEPRSRCLAERIVYGMPARY